MKTMSSSDMKRRSFLGASAAAAGSLLLRGQAGGAVPPTFDPFEEVTLGRTGMKVSRMCLGTGMKGLPEEERADANAAVERFLSELKTDRLDLVLLHCVTQETWPAELRRQMDLLAGLKQKGVILSHGVSCHAIPALRAAAAEPWVDTLHARINPYGVVMDGPAAEVAPVLAQATKNGKGIFGMKLLGEGRFRDDAEKKDETLRYVLGLGTVDVLLVGCENLAEVDDFAARVRRVPRPAAPRA